MEYTIRCFAEGIQREGFIQSCTGSITASGSPVKSYYVRPQIAQGEQKSGTEYVLYVNVANGDIRDVIRILREHALTILNDPLSHVTPPQDAEPRSEA